MFPYDVKYTGYKCKEVGPLEEQHGSAAKTVSFVMAVTLIGKVLGLYRDRLLAVHYSTGAAANA